MWEHDASAPVAEFLGWILCSSLLVDGLLLNLEPYSVAFAETGTLTLGYLLYAVIGMLFSTSAPCICLFLVLRRHERITLRAYVRRSLRTPRPLAAMLITGGFAMNLLVWSFALAAIYKATQSVLACAAYHAFINAIGAVYDWNALFDAYPKNVPMMVYFAVIFLASILIWLAADRIERKKEYEESNQDRPARGGLSHAGRGLDGRRGGLTGLEGGHGYHPNHPDRR